MRSGTLLLGAFTVLLGMVFWSLWDRSLHFNLWIDYLSPCLFPAILLVGFGGIHRLGAERGAEGGFARFMKRNGLTYAGLLGAAMAVLWWREGVGSIPYILFFGLPYFAVILAATAVICLLGHSRPAVRTLWIWLWLGFGVCYGASCLTMAGGLWTAVPFLLLPVPGLVRSRQRLFALLGASTLWSLVAAALTLGYWRMEGFWRIPWHVTRVPYGLIPWGAGAGAALWAAHRFGGSALRRIALIGGRALGTAAAVTVLLFAGAGGWNYLGDELAWTGLVRYRVVFEADAGRGLRQAEEIIGVQRKFLPAGRLPVGSLRVRGSLPSLQRLGRGVILADMEMDRAYLKGLPAIAREALLKRTGQVPAPDAPMELVGPARPAIRIISVMGGGTMRTVPYENNNLGIRFRAWLEVLDGADRLDRLFVVRGG